MQKEINQEGHNGALLIAEKWGGRKHSYDDEEKLKEAKTQLGG